MKSGFGRASLLISAGFAVGPVGVSNAMASDIACRYPVSASPARCQDPYGAGIPCMGPGPRPRRLHLICEYSMLSLQYERIYAEQQRRLRAGAVQRSDIDAWRARRDACKSIPCLDGLFSQFWQRQNAMRSAPAQHAFRPQAARQWPGHDSPARALPGVAAIPPPLPESAHQPGDDGSTLVASLGLPLIPYSAAVTAPTAAPLEPPPTGSTAMAPARSPRPSRAAALVMESMVAGLTVLMIEVVLFWYRLLAYEQEKGPRPLLSVLAILFFALLVINALLLPFTLVSK